jgi:hypothetical protein
MFPKAADEAVTCEDCGSKGASLKELQAKITTGHLRESRRQRLARHAREVAESHAQLRDSVAETDRLIIASNEMIRRHRKEDEDAGD